MKSYTLTSVIITVKNIKHVECKTYMKLHKDYYKIIFYVILNSLQKIKLFPKAVSCSVHLLILFFAFTMSEASGKHKSQLW